MLSAIALIAVATTATGAGAPARVRPAVWIWEADSLVAAKLSLDRGETALRPARDQLLVQATALLERKPPSVLDKPRPGPSGDPHDYYSLAPYWWPDPAKSNGLPYVRRDGEINPASREGTDDGALDRLASGVETLALAYWFSGDERFAAQAARFVRVWFIDPATRMAPHGRHAQAILGLNDGRGIGIIEFRRFMQVNESLALLAGSPSWTSGDRAALRQWMEEFSGWLTTSSHGQDEKAEANNHGTWYDAQTAHLALVLGRSDEAARILTRSRAERIARQIQPDGSQPLELARTKSLGYSLYNLEALFTCARLGEHVGVDWWSHQTNDNRSLQAALAYLAPYMDPQRAWPRHDLDVPDRTKIVVLAGQYLRRRDDASLRKLHARFLAQAPSEARWRLWELAAEKPAAARRNRAPDETPLALPGATTFVFRREGTTELRLHVFQPEGRQTGQCRPALVCFFGGGWNNGSPARMADWARWAAGLGLVGVAPDYRVRDRFGGTPEDCVADGRAAIAWLAEHAAEVGIDPARIAVLGSSAGAHVAAWTAITAPGPGGVDAPPATVPVGLILVNPVSDTKQGGYGGPKRFGGSAERALACSVTDQMPARMPPALIFHGTADETVPYANSVALHDRLVANGNSARLVTFDGLGHSLISSQWGEAGKDAGTRVRAEAQSFLAELGLLQAGGPRPTQISPPAPQIPSEPAGTKTSQTPRP